MQKHAYMIIAHNEFDLLEILVRLLDDPRNDIYIHIDAKVKDFDFKSFQALTQYSRLRFTPRRISATWGDFSLVNTELLLLQTKRIYKGTGANCFSVASSVSCRSAERTESGCTKRYQLV